METSKLGRSRCGARETNPTSIHEASLSGSGIWHCRELWYRSQMQLGSRVAVAVAGSYSSNSTPSLGSSICRRCGLKKQKEKSKPEA